MTDELSTQRIVGVDANEIFAQFGLGSPSTTQNISQTVEQINVGTAAQDASYVEVTPEALPEEINLTNEIIEEDRGAILEIIENDAPLGAYIGTDAAGSVDIGVNYEIVQETESENLSTSNVNELLQTLTEEDKKPAIPPFIPENPKSILVKETTSRFSGAAWFEEVQKQTIIVAGQGGIGGYITFLLSRMNPKQIFIYDDDTVELGNLSGQFYSMNNIGQKKVNAMANLVNKFSNYFSVMACPNKFTENTPAGDIMISGFDNMDARATFFDVWKKHVAGKTLEERGKCLYIDARLAAEEFQVFCFTGNDYYYQEQYRKKYLFSDSQADATMCSYKQTSHCATMVGSIAVNLFTNFIANLLNPPIKRDLPFKTYYDASLMFFKTES